jgi:hypothetical protein
MVCNTTLVPDRFAMALEISGNAQLVTQKLETDQKYHKIGCLFQIVNDEDRAGLRRSAPMVFGRLKRHRMPGAVLSERCTDCQDCPLSFQSPRSGQIYKFRTKRKWLAPQNRRFPILPVMPSIRLPHTSSRGFFESSSPD